jgi:hypothetical protein
MKEKRVSWGIWTEVMGERGDFKIFKAKIIKSCMQAKKIQHYSLLAFLPFI